MSRTRTGKTKTRTLAGPVARMGEPRLQLPPGLAARNEAVRLVSAVLMEQRALDDALGAAEKGAGADLEGRDRGFARLLAATVLRRLGSIEAAIATFLEKPLPARCGRLRPILYSATAQLLFLDTPAHAAISLAVEQVKRDRAARRFDGLANAVLRKISADRQHLLDGRDTLGLDIPDWLFARWLEAYGEDLGRQIATAQLVEAPLDLTVRADPATWAPALDGLLLAGGAIRLKSHGRIEMLPGYQDGAWWVQDVAATLPARILGARPGERVADLCAAPGGKTAQLAAAGAVVTSLDKSAARLKRLGENLARLSLPADLVEADLLDWKPAAPFGKVLLDAPCTATGTIRRHPDILRLRRPSDVAALAELQSRLIDAAAAAVAPGGTLVYCTCSLEPEECGLQIEDFLARNDGFMRAPIGPDEVDGAACCITPAGDLRTLPCFDPAGLPPDLPPEMSGMDGFYAARLKRTD